MPNNICGAGEYRLKFDQCAWGESNGVDPSGKSLGSGNSFGATQISCRIRILIKSNCKEDLDETKKRD